ncbi:MAG: rhomboid family intramembrane serine protease [Bacteroidales bacterium]|nr:rhomboid family intramembrane serine protease [Bacteroidales bacterium]
MNLILIAVTVIVSIVAFGNRELFDRLKFTPYQIKNQRQSWRFLSYALVHAGWLHLLINMWVLYSFGSIVERTFQLQFGMKGLFYYVLLYVGGILFSTLFDYGKYKNNVYYSAVGASGAVSAVVFASILIFPTGGIMLFPIPFSIPSWLFGILYLVYSAYMARNGKDNVGHSAHFWGAVFGLVFTAIVVPHVIETFIRQLFG